MGCYCVFVIFLGTHAYSILSKKYCIFKLWQEIHEPLPDASNLLIHSVYELHALVTNNL
jgi:hypothetical protein